MRPIPSPSHPSPSQPRQCRNDLFTPFLFLFFFATSAPVSNAPHLSACLTHARFQLTLLCPPRLTARAHHASMQPRSMRFTRDEILGLYVKSTAPLPDMAAIPAVFRAEHQLPMAFTPLNDEEKACWPRV